MPDQKTTKSSDSVQVDEYMQKLDHPLKSLSESIRHAILNADSRIGEEIKWNAPSFFFTGPLAPFDPKEYKRVIVNFNYFKKDCIRLIFLKADKILGASELLEGDYQDGRRLALFHDSSDFEAKKTLLQRVVRDLATAIGE